METAQTTTTAAVITTSITILVSLTYDGHVAWNKMLRYGHTIHCIHVIVVKSDVMLSVPIPAKNTAELLMMTSDMIVYKAEFLSAPKNDNGIKEYFLSIQK